MLVALLWTTIVVTFVCWCIPLLFLPRPVLVQMHVPVTESILFVRLLGVAMFALCIMYLFGVTRAYQGHNVSDVLVVAVVHNGMAGAILWRYALHGHYTGWPRFASLYVYASGGILTALSLALLLFGFWYG